MARKMFVTLTIQLVINAEEGVDVNDVIDEMDYDFISQTENADIIDNEIIDFDVTDSK